MTGKVTTPTVSELLNAANWEYNQVGVPADLRPFLVNGRQLSAFDEARGISASAWLTPHGQVVVSYLGTQFVSAVAAGSNPLFSVAQVLGDAGVASGAVTPGEQAAAAFARTVQTDAARQGIAASDVFLTGHSLGGIQAQYAAQQTGLGGMAFESTGIPRSTTDAGNGRNFVNVVTYGDSVANYSSDIRGEQPFAPKYAPGGVGSLPHYGYVAMIGSAADQASLALEAQPSRLGPAGAALTAALYGANLAAFHLPDVQAHDLGVTLTQTPLGDRIGVTTGPVLPAANDSVMQFIAADHARYSAPLPPVPGTSPGSGGQAAAALTQAGPIAAALLPTVSGILSTPIGLDVNGILDSYGLTANVVSDFLSSLLKSPLAGPAVLSGHVPESGAGSLFDVLHAASARVPALMPAHTS